MQLQIKENNTLAQIQREPSINSRERESFWCCHTTVRFHRQGAKLMIREFFFSNEMKEEKKIYNKTKKKLIR